MKTKINALVVDDSMEFTSSVKEYFTSNAVINIVDVLTDGEKVVNYIKAAIGGEIPTKSTEAPKSEFDVDFDQI